MVRSTDRERMMGRLGEPDRLGLVRGRLGESAELGEAHDQPEAVVDGGWSAASKVLVDSIGGEGRGVVRGTLDPPFRRPARGMQLSQVPRRRGAEGPMT